MINKLKTAFVMIPIAAMIVSSAVFIKSLFYNFHEDTLPLFSMFLSCSVSFVCIVLDAGMICLAFLFFNKPNAQRQTLLIGLMFLLDLAFSVLRMIVQCVNIRLVIITGVCFLITSVFFALSALFCKLGADREQ